MELLTSPKTEYLLQVSLESLHAESVEWLREIEFWQEEMSFIFRILRKKEVFKTLPPDQLEALDKEMINLMSYNIDKARAGVKQHERDLKEVLHAIVVGQEKRYRDSHRTLLIEVHRLYQLIRDFKKRTFDFIKKNESSR
jgi:hypothetical protein